MKRIKAIIAIMLSFIMMLSVTMSEKAGAKEVRADVQFAITSPINGSMRGAGYVDIIWTSASPFGTVKAYKVYIDGKLETSTTALEYEFYTTKVNYHNAWVVAEFADDTEISTTTVRFGVTKKGLCVDSRMGRCLNAELMNVGWYYNWGTDPFLEYPTYSDLEFVPMIWGTKFDSSIASVKSKNYKYVLAYNEPDAGNDVGGSNIDVNTVISHWNKFSGIGQYVGAPAPAQSPSWSSGTWFRTFMNGIDQSTIDFIPLHCYYGQYGGADGANTFLEEVVDATWEMYHKPIWITEFAVSGWSYNDIGARASVNDFLKTAIAGLNSRDYVERYAWFSFDTTNTGNGASALWTNSTGVLTNLGNTYVTYGNPTSDYQVGTAVNNYKHSSDIVIKNTQNQNANQNTNQNVSTINVKKPDKVKIKSAKNLKGKKIKLTWKKISGAKGYQIKYSDSKKFNGSWIKSTKKTSYTIRKLDKNTKYYITVRAFVNNGKNKLYGSWSKVKKIKVKK